MFARCRAVYRSVCRAVSARAPDARWWLWRHVGLPLPARDGWQALIAEVVDADGAYASEDDGVIGAPLAWSLYTRAGTVLPTPYETACAWTGVPISPTSMPFGVRCARCGVPLACTVAGMKTSCDVPSCLPCRSSVRRAIQSLE